VDAHSGKGCSQGKHHRAIAVNVTVAV
jgi:hypothetical protein